MDIIRKRKEGPLYLETIRIQRRPKEQEEVATLIASGLGWLGNAKVIDRDDNLVFRGRVYIAKGAGNSRLTIFQPFFCRRSFLVRTDQFTTSLHS